MTIDQIVELGLQIQLKAIHLLTPLVSLFVLCIIFLLYLLLIRDSIKLTSLKYHLGIGIILIAVLSVIHFFDYEQALANDETFPSRFESWKLDLVYPYINQLNVEKQDIKSFSFDENLEREIREDRERFEFFTIVYTNEETKDLVPLTIEYMKDGKSKTISGLFEVMIDDNAQKPYITYQRLEQTLPHGYRAGMYNLQVHVDPGSDPRHGNVLK
ncbi:hypothetical protein V1503_20305 [Bacillus sp. SCS-151]|uniref:hypothetical protein n=1 Tax=Nanhaiella sioensis TaxID=3115293 RepID=UPI003978FF03